MWDIYSVGDGEFLASVLNAVAMLTGTGDFATLVRIGFGIGVLLIALQGALSGGRGIDWQHAMIGLVIYMVMFGPQVRVNVEDMYSGQVYPVDNVPFGVAATGSVLSRAGYSITTLFETAFGTPAMTEQSYGMSLKRLQATREAMLNRINTGEANSPIPGSDVEKSWVNYVQECTLTAIDLHEQNPSAGLSLDSVLNGRLPDALHFADSEFYFTEIYVGGAPQTLSCDQAFVQLANFTNNVFLPAAKQNIKAFMAPDSFLTTDQLLQDAMYGIEQYGVNIDTYLKAVYLTPIYGDAVVQHHLGSKQDVMAAIVNEAVQRRNAQWQAQKSVFETSVQPFMTFMEALFYALTPIMGLVIGLGMMGMKMIGKYLVLALWVQMWMPVMAIVNHYIHAAAAGKISSVLAAVVSEPMSITGMAQWDGIIQNQLAVGGMLASSVPIIALFIVSGSYYALTNVAGQMTGQDHIDESKGAPKTSAPVTFGPMQQWDAERGLHGSEAQSAMTTFSWSAQDAQQTASSQEAMHAATGNFSSMLGQRVSAMSGTSQKGGESFSFGSGTRVGNSQSENMLRQKAESLSDKWSHTEGLTTETLASFGAAAAAGSSQGSLKSSIQQSTKLSESEATALADDLTSKFTEDESWNAQYNQQVAKEFSQGSENIYTRGTGLSEDKQLQEAAQESYSATEKYNEAVTSGVTVGTRQDVDGVKAGKNLAANSSANARLESAIDSAGFHGAVEQWMASASGEDTIRQMGGDRDAAQAYAMLLTANGQNQYADMSQINASDKGILQDTANSSLAQTFGQVGGPAFGDRASSNAGIADGHVPQQGSVEGQVSNAVGDMRVPQADQVRGNASMGLAHAQEQSRGPSDQSMYGDYQGRTDHIQAASNPSFEEFKAEDQARTQDEIEKQNDRETSSQFAAQVGGGLSETGNNMLDVLGAAKDAYNGKGGFQEGLNARAEQQYYEHYEAGLSHGLPEDQAEYYARRASQAGLDDRGLDSLAESGWFGEKAASTLGFDVDYAKQTDAMGEKLDPEVRESLDKAAFEGGQDGLRLERVGDLSNPYEHFPEREGLASNNEPAASPYSPGNAFNSFMPPQNSSAESPAVANEQSGSGLVSDEPSRPTPDAASGASERASDYGATSPIEGPAAATGVSGQPHDGAPVGEGTAQPGTIDTGTPPRSEVSGQNNSADEPFIPSIDSIPSENVAGYGEAPALQAATPAISAAQTSSSIEPAADRTAPAPTTFESSIAPEPGMGMAAGYEQPARTTMAEGAPSASYPASNDPPPADAGTDTTRGLNKANTTLEAESAIEPGVIQSGGPNSVGSSSQPADENQGLSWTMAGSFAAAGADTAADNAAADASWADTMPAASYNNGTLDLSDSNQPSEPSQPEPAVAQAQHNAAEQGAQPAPISNSEDNAGMMASAAPAFTAMDSPQAESGYGANWADASPAASYDNDAPGLSESNQPIEPSQPDPAIAQAQAQANDAGLNAQSAPASSAEINTGVAPSAAPAFAASGSSEAEPTQGANWAGDAPAASYDNDAPGLSESNQPSEPQHEPAMAQANGVGAAVQGPPISSADDSAGMMASSVPAFAASDSSEAEPAYGANWADASPAASYDNGALGLSEPNQPVESPSEPAPPPATEHAQQQDSDWFNDAFGSNQGGTSSRETTVRAAEEEQLRQEMLETIIVDESDVRDAGNTFGQDMGRS